MISFQARDAQIANDVHTFLWLGIITDDVSEARGGLADRLDRSRFRVDPRPILFAGTNSYS